MSSPQLPCGWAATQLGELGTLHCGQSPPAAEVNEQGTGTPYVSGPDQWDGSHLEARKWTTAPRRLVPDGCIFVTVGAGVGTIFPGVACAIGRDIYAYEPHRGGERDSLCFQSTLHRFRPVPAGPSSEFAQTVFRSHVKSGVFRRFGSITTNIGHLTLEKLRTVPFPLPPRAEQVRIIAEVERLMSFADVVSTAIATGLSRATRLRLRQAILKRAFEGKLVPQDPNDEHASVLLERIRKEREAAASEASSQPKRRRAMARPRKARA